MSLPVSRATWHDALVLSMCSHGSWVAPVAQPQQYQNSQGAEETSPSEKAAHDLHPLSIVAASVSLTTMLAKKTSAPAAVAAHHGRAPQKAEAVLALLETMVPEELRPSGEQEVAETARDCGDGALPEELLGRHCLPLRWSQDLGYAVNVYA